jgi:hypothetical protein
MWLGVVSMHNESSLISCTVKRADFGKHMINLIFARLYLPFKRDKYQMESMWIPYDSQHYFRTVDRLAVNYCTVTAVQRPDFS